MVEIAVKSFGTEDWVKAGYGWSARMKDGLFEIHHYNTPLVYIDTQRRIVINGYGFTESDRDAVNSLLWIFGTGCKARIAETKDRLVITQFDPYISGYTVEE